MTVEELGALDDAVNVTIELHVGLQLSELNALAVTPLGKAVAMLKLTCVVLPDVSAAVAVSTPPTPPGVIVRVDGEALRLTCVGDVTISVNVVVWVTAGEPLLARMVMTAVEEGALTAAVKVT